MKKRIRVFGDTWDREYWEQYLRYDPDWIPDQDDAGRIESDYDYASRLILYATTILQRRDSWIEDQILASGNEYLMYSYVDSVVKGRWPAAEPFLERSRQMGPRYRQYLYDLWSRQEGHEIALKNLLVLNDVLEQYN